MNDLRADINKVAGLDDPLERARRAHQLVGDLSTLSAEATRLRREALEELLNLQHMSQSEIARHLDVSRARVSQLLKSGPRPERAFLGYGELTVLLGGKQEGSKEKPGPVVSTEDLNGYALLADAAKELGLTTRYEVVQPPGMFNLNRDNLVVACGPRLSPLVEQVLHSDPNLAFERDEQGWYLVDRVQGVVHRSPMESGENTDYGYIARLPRFDSNGTFLYAAGIHAPGVSGGLHYIVNNLAELYDEVKRQRFSMLVAATFDPDTRKIIASERVSPLYRSDQGR